MARASNVKNLPTKPDRHGQAMVAAAYNIDLADPREADKYRNRKGREWQKLAWDYYDEIGEVWFAQEFVGNCLRKIRLVPAIFENPDEPPVPIDADNPAGPLGAQAVLEIDRLKGQDGTHGQLLHDMGVNFGVAGEGHLVGYVDPETLVEEWGFYSYEALKTQDRDWVVMKSPDDKSPLKLNPETDVATRMWRQHPRWYDWPNSPMRAILDRCEELQLLSANVRASARSRMNAGMLLWPGTEIEESVDPTEEGEEGADPLLKAMMKVLMTPIANEANASAVVPFLVRMDPELIDKVRHLIFERPIDPVAVSLREEAIRRIATGQDIPNEVLLGLGDINHWTAWQISEETFKSHIEPLVLMIVNALTADFLKPLLGDTTGQTQLVVWYDATALIGHPDRARDVKDAHDRFLISDAAGRDYLGFTEEDAPTDEEIQSRVLRKAIVRINDTAEESPTDVIGGEPGPPAAGPVAPDQTQSSVTASVSAFARRPKVPSGMTLAGIDRDLRARITQAADMTAMRTLEKAGAALRRKVGRGMYASQINGVPQHLVASILGPDQVREWFADGELIGDGMAHLEPRYQLWVSRAQQRVRQIAADFGEYDEDQVREAQNEQRAAGWAFLALGLTSLVNNRLFAPDLVPPPVGEFDDTVSIPAGLVRQSLSRAGGAGGKAQGGAIVDVIGQPSGGVATGDTALDLFKQVGLTLTGYVWMYGDPSSRKSQFDYHLDLDGVEFASFDDDALGADAGEWPYVDHFFPGDHEYCQCDFAPNITQEA